MNFIHYSFLDYYLNFNYENVIRIMKSNRWRNADVSTVLYGQLKIYRNLFFTDFNLPLIRTDFYSKQLIRSLVTFIPFFFQYWVLQSNNKGKKKPE